MIDLIFNLVPYLYKVIKNYKTSTRIKIDDDGSIRIFIPFRKKVQLKAVSISCKPGENSTEPLKILERENRQKTYKLVLERELKRKLSLNEQFLDDSDMKGNFMLHLLVIKQKGMADKVIYSARTFNNYECIFAEVKGEEGLHAFNSSTQEHTVHKDIPEEIVDPDKNNLCVDRLAMNSSNLRIALRHGFNDAEIRGFFYNKIIRANPNTQEVFALARFSKFDTLKTQYVRLGMNVLGYNCYTVFGELLKHHVLKGNVNAVKTNLKRLDMMISAMFKNGSLTE